MNVQYYRLCPLGHKVICPNSLVRPRCGICGQQADSQSPLRRLDEEPEVTIREQAPEVVPDTPDPVPADTPDPAAGSTGRQRRTSEQPEQQISPLPGRERRRRTADIAPVSDPEPDTPADAPEGAVKLDLFGDTIAIPTEGGFLGRDGIGAQQLEGFLLVSRRHVFVNPDRGGRLMVEDRGSTNGTWYTHANRRQRLEVGRAQILEPGDILWLYNIPLKVVT